MLQEIGLVLCCTLPSPPVIHFPPRVCFWVQLSFVASDPVRFRFHTHVAGCVGRWFLAVTLLRNPDLCHLRAHYLRWQRQQNEMLLFGEFYLRFSGGGESVSVQGCAESLFFPFCGDQGIPLPRECLSRTRLSTTHICGQRRRNNINSFCKFARRRTRRPISGRYLFQPPLRSSFARIS